MVPDVTPISDVELIEQLQAAYERWMALCTMKAQEEGTSEELLRQELTWLHWRLQSLERSGNRQHIQAIIQNMADAEIWVGASGSESMRDGPAAEGAGV